MRSSPARREVELEATVTELAPGGDGVAIVELDGERRAVFARGAARGDLVRMRVDASRRPARGAILAVVSAGPDRVAPACAWADRCGGCDWMHVSLRGQEEAHASHVKAALARALGDLDVTVHPAPAGLAYRMRARLHVVAKGGAVQVGMNEAGGHEPVPVDACVVLLPELERARRRLADLLEGARGRGEAKLALGRPGEGGARRAVLELAWSGSLAPAIWARLERGVRAGEWAGARVTESEAAAPAVVGDPTPWMMGGDGEPLRLAPGGFGQASEEANARLVGRVVEIARGVLPRGAGTDEAGGHAKVVELYAGAGNLTVALARLATGVVAVELDRGACAAARANLEARGLGAAARVVEADAAGYAWSGRPRLVVLDPPRTGALEVVRRLAEAPARHVLYVACDAQTLGRDVLVLAGAGYRASIVETFEMFPQTSHVEAVVLLSRGKA